MENKEKKGRKGRIVFYKRRKWDFVRGLEKDWLVDGSTEVQTRY